MLPVFNISVFQSVVNVQMNLPMAQSLLRMINETDIDHDGEKHLVALRMNLQSQLSANKVRRPN